MGGAGPGCSGVCKMPVPRQQRLPANPRKPRPGTRTISSTFVLVLAALAAPGAHSAETRSSDWPYYGADAGSTKYSPLAQIDAGNVQSLQVAWTWSSPD